MVRKEILAIVVLAVASLLPTFVQAGGLSLYEIGTADVGLASAGKGSDVAPMAENSGRNGAPVVSNLPIRVLCR